MSRQSSRNPTAEEQPVGGARGCETEGEFVTTPQLDRRRAQSAAAGAAAEKARQAVTELDNRLRTNTELAQQQSQALRNAEAEVKRLKRSLKTQERDRVRLTKAHKKATAKASKAGNRAADADPKYDKAVLADLIRREKQRDQAAAEAPV